jgi:sugar phosphate isomerase/epimerase
MLSRRAILMSPIAMMAATSVSAAARMTLAIHQNTSSGAGYRRSLEGWARAGITRVEITTGLLDEFLKTESLATAKRVMTDLGLTPVSAACGVQNLWQPTPNHAAALDDLRRRCQMFADLGLAHIYAPVGGGMQKFTEDDYKVGADNVRAAGEVAKQFRMTIMAEFVRGSSFISTLPTILKVSRAAAHANFAIVFDCYHFWSGLNKLEDLEALRPGDIGHVHFQDVPDMPRELLDNTTRFIPGDGVTPLTRILRKLGEKGYSGPLSVELFLPKFQQGDPFEVAREIRQKAEAVMRSARVT